VTLTKKFGQEDFYAKVAYHADILTLYNCLDLSTVEMKGAGLEYLIMMLKLLLTTKNSFSGKASYLR